MNKYILKVMRYIDNPDLFTSEDMQSNVYDAASDSRIATRIATRMAANAANAAYTANAANAANATYTAYTANAANATNAAAYYAIDWYFKRTGEDKERYNNEVERLR